MELEAIKVLLDSQERTLRSAMDMVVKQLQDRINKAEQSVDEVIKSLEFSQAEVLDLKNEVKELTKSNKDKQLLLEEIQSKQTPVSFGASRDDDRFRIHDGVGAVGGGSVDCMLSAEGAVGFAHCGGGGRVRSSSPHPSSGEKATAEVPVTDSTTTGAPGTVSGEPLPRGAARMSTGATKKQEPTGGTVVQNQKNLRERKKR
ncbi:hypothetical protein Pmani_006805 [Petrolisthes manimaculis]|uniref:Uncharacterized protein n=1 Tax=Petrolisthes manimaculis TaxID=1843537 RepID=A0AAE1QAA0_9EUCA|nr:hypothetical protein Pmani_006805 [Petrolisthes manimaculis]